jgi:hypothetical protein
MSKEKSSRRGPPSNCSTMKNKKNISGFMGRRTGGPHINLANFSRNRRSTVLDSKHDRPVCLNILQEANSISAKR